MTEPRVGPGPLGVETHYAATRCQLNHPPPAIYVTVADLSREKLLVSEIGRSDLVIHVLVLA